MKYFSIIASFLVFLNCTNEKTVFDENHDEPLAMALSPEDPELQKSIIDAQESLDVFIRLYKEFKGKIGVFFAIKVPIKDGRDTAHFWYTYRGIDNNKLIGEHFELPPDLVEYKSIEVAKQEIEDWMIIDHGHLYGGYSIRLQRKKLPEEMKKKFDEYVGVKVYMDNDF